MFGLGLLGLVGMLWLRSARKSAQRSGSGLGRRFVGGFAVFVGGVMGLEGLLQFNGAAKWQTLALGFLVGGIVGAVAGRLWIVRHIGAETAAQPSRVSRWLVSWRFQVVLVAVLFLIAMLPPFTPIFALASSRTDLQGAVQEGLAGLFLILGLVLGMGGGWPRH